MPRILGFLIAVLISSVSAAIAQDVRLSIEPYSWSVPPQGQIQSAAHIGNTTLAVWGTVGFHGDSAGTIELRMQIVRGTEPMDSPALLHSLSARPSYYVRVIPMDSLFLVVWNDYRVSAQGIYVQRVDIYGNRVGEETRLSSGMINSDSSNSLVLLGSPDLGVLLAWEDTTAQHSGFYTRRITPNGVLDGSEVRMGNKYGNFIPYQSVAGFDILSSDSIAVLVDRAGRINPDIHPASFWADPISVAADSSFAVVRGDSVLEYRNVLVPFPYRTTKIGALDTAVDGSVIISRLNNGARTIVIKSRTAPKYTLSTFEVTLYDSTSNTTSDTLKTLQPTGTWQYPAKINAVIHQHLCDGRQTFLMKVQEAIGGGAHDQVWETYDKYTVDTEGKYWGDSTATQVGPCNFSNDRLITRISSDSAFKLVVAVGQSPVTLYSSVSRQTLHINQTIPCIKQVNNKLFVTYIQPAGFAPCQLIEWQPSSIIPSLLIGNANTPPQPYEVSLYTPVTNIQSSVSALHSDGTMGLVSWNLYSVTAGTPNTPEPLTITTCTLQYPTSNGWNLIGERADALSQSGQEMIIFAYGTSYDPNRNEVLFNVGRYSPDRRGDPCKISAIGSDGSINWQMDSVFWLRNQDYYRHGIIIIPLGERSVISLADSVPFVVTDGRIVDTLASIPNFSDMRRLLGNRMLQYTTPDSTCQLFLYDLRANLVRSRNVIVRNRQGPVFILQNPRDSSIGVLWGTAHGVHMALLDQNLNIFQPDLLVSETQDSALAPAATYFHDSLAVVWEDYRNGTADIYGNIRPAPKLIADVRMGGAAISEELSVHPNPAHDWIEVILPLMGSKLAMLHLYDLLGRSVLSLTDESGFSIERVNISGVQAGNYLLVAQSGERLWRKMIQIKSH